MTEETDETKDPRKGTGFYPSFHALWHLLELGVVQRDSDGLTSDAWNAVSGKGVPDPVRIVIMDTTVDWKHPNLQGVIDASNMQDFSGTNEGEDLIPEDKDPADPNSKPKPYTGPTIYGAHGTAVAGLIGARPATVDLQLRERVGLPNENADQPEGDESCPQNASDQPEEGDDKTDGCADQPDEGDSNQKKITLPYAGINPFCTIIPISLTAAPDPDMVLAALRYIGGLDPEPQIIVVAAAWDDTPRAQQDKQSFDKSEGKWSQVDAVLRTLCEKSLVLCAAGNAGAGEMAYPAILAGRFPGLIAVTACDTKGNPLTYAYVPKPGQKKIIATLSTQSSRYDRKRVSLDPWAEVDPYLKMPEGDTEFPKQRIISLDPRGRRGYNPSIYRYDPPTNGPHLEIASLYAEFSGTSAATAIAAGLISLAMQRKKKMNLSDLDLSKLPEASVLFDLDAASDLIK